ncbi:MAG: hypothetical protein RBS73_14190 [Prolixibacteraceae bacterium]|jgi:hypothetical protein|nr:hypothetical protein [Prolixibacteraceae bacterium]
MKKLQLCISFLFIAGFFAARAQESVTVSGGGASGNDGSVSYSVGQIVYTTHTGSTVSLAQGVQQPYEISVVTGLNDVSDIQLDLSAYPNPTVDVLRLRMNRS